MGTTVTFKMTSVNPKGFTATPPYTPAYKDGQILFVKDIGKIYVDYDNSRTCYTPDVPASSGSGLNYLGVATTDPTKANGAGIVTINGESVTPSLKDMVVYGTKEYIWRQGEIEDPNNPGQMLSVTQWFEIGDESAPGWETD
jgi:hypothetical protein